MGKPLSDFDKIFEISRALGKKYRDFKLVVLSKPPYRTFNQFILSLQNYEQFFLMEEKQKLDHNQAFLSQRDTGRGQRGGGRFSGRGGFTQNQPHNQNQPQNFPSSSHRKPNFNNNWNQRQQGQFNKENPKDGYQICGRTNHTAIKCYYKYDYASEEENAQQDFSAKEIQTFMLILVQQFI